jgi:hypothetical protein
VLVAGAALIAAAAAVAVAVLTLGRGPGISEPPATGTPGTRATVANGVVRISVAPPWEEADASAPASLELSDQIAVRREGASVVVGQSRAVGPRLLPAAFVRALAHPVPQPERVRAGALTALRYADLRLPGIAEPTTVLAAPVTGGVVTVVCMSGPCDELLGAIELTSASALPPEAGEPYASELRAALKPLARARARALSAFRRASSRRAQSVAADRVAAAFAAFSDARGAAEVGAWDAGLERAITKAATRARGAYARMATAAARGREDDYATARVAALAAERRVRAALESADELGYTLVPATAVDQAMGTEIGRLPAVTTLPPLEPRRKPVPTMSPGTVAPAPTPQRTAPPAPTQAAPVPAPTRSAPTPAPIPEDEGGGGSGGGEGG